LNRVAVVIETIVELVVNVDDHPYVEAGLFVGAADFLAEDIEGWMMDVQ
jgi:hypothetical protein